MGKKCKRFKKNSVIFFLLVSFLFSCQTLSPAFWNRPFLALHLTGEHLALQKKTSFQAYIYIKEFEKLRMDVFHSFSVLLLTIFLKGKSVHLKAPFQKEKMKEVFNRQKPWIRDVFSSNKELFVFLRNQIPKAWSCSTLKASLTCHTLSRKWKILLKENKTFKKVIFTRGLKEKWVLKIRPLPHVKMPENLFLEEKSHVTL